MNLFEFTLRLNGFPIKEAKEHLAKIQAIPESEYEDYIKKQRQEIVDYHIKNNPFYQKFIGDKNIENWKDIPIMTKNDLQIPLNERLSKGFTKKNCYINKTSGSSGHPLIFAKDKYCHAMTWAEIINRFGWFGIDFNRSYQARFYGIPLDFIGNKKERLKDWLSHRFRFPVFDLSEKKLESYFKIFNQKKFYYINGYTSSIVLFAKFLKSKNTVLTQVCPTLKYCVVTSEMLFDKDKTLLERWLGVPIINEYGAAELDLIAFTNTKDEFIVNSETLFVEILDEANQPVKNGVSGKIVITSLYNKAHPLIRYEIGDAGILSEKSTFKTPIIEKLIGRTNDIATLPSGKVVPGLTFYYVTKSVIEDDGNVKEFIIEQNKLDAFHIVYVSEIELNSDEIANIKKALNDYLESNLNLTFKRVEVLKRNKRGKLKQFISKINK
ncbi:MAG: phenylacetate--CoA ligase family protein [Flavobacteriaceae bacterium]|nr:phenylacetate--CoA ligase family protein [Flavobacteriaceae bacterium]